MNGEYDSYGRVFDKEGYSVRWSIPWSDVCELMFNKHRDNGIAAYHEECYAQIAPTTPVVRSSGDPDQGWGEFERPPKPFERG